MIITRNNEDEVARLQDEFSIRFDIKKLGELHLFLGLEVTNMNKWIFVTQEGYAKKLVDRFGLKQSKTCSTPLDIRTRLRRDEGSLFADPKPFRALIGSLLYLIITRPDIEFSVGHVSRLMQRTRKPHLEAEKRILNYINSTSDMGLFFQKKNDLVLATYTDADFGGDLEDRRSTSSYPFLCGGTSVSWCSKKQDSVSLSTTDAEYKAVALTAQECVWLQRLAEDLHLPISNPIVIYGDNQSSFKLANNPASETLFLCSRPHLVKKKSQSPPRKIKGRGGRLQIPRSQRRARLESAQQKGELAEQLREEIKLKEAETLGWK
ncbi:uncharacterized mitochondrial protein AtMg00810-like [Nicotiana sylvestris]|uniref:uncharacterized mitochondrial protein AtMg00810-like n=1 Tax=Nicotiana sylvestris TaxID=4096 RepID=UPI00388C7504